MDTWLIVVIVVAAIVLVALLAMAAIRGRERRLETRRTEAAELRAHHRESRPRFLRY